VARPSGRQADRAGFSAPDGEAALRLQQLARVTTELGAAESMDDVVAAAVDHIAAAIGAAVSTLMLTDGDLLQLVAGSGIRPGVLTEWERFAIADENPASEAARLGRPVVVSHEATLDNRYPSLAGQVPEGRSIVCLPLAAGTPVGVLGLTFDDNWLPGPRELDFLTTFAEACGQAVRRVRAASVAAERAQHLTFLADASAALASSLDYRSTLANVANLVVPGLADWCSVDVLEGDRLVTLAVAHVDPAKVEWAWDLQRRYPPDADATQGAQWVARTGESQLLVEITDDMLVAGARDEEHLALARGLNLRSALVVPLAAHGRPLGAMSLLRAENDRPYGPADLAVAEDLGRRAGIAIENAMLHSQTRDTAVQLQRAVLPDRLAEIPGWQIASHYEPGGTAEVGGDFYDAVALPDGRLALFVGDVMGHGVPAAAAMAQLRASVRAFLSIDPEPQTVLTSLQRMFGLLSINRLVTLVYAVIDPSAARVELVNAGHYPPLVVPADGPASWAQTAPRRLLGTEPDDCTATTLPYLPGDTLLLFTDGLVERRSEVIDVGLKRALGHADVLLDSDLPAALARFVELVQGDDGDDDITALAVRAD
jgi:GAF domain-containing protein